MRSLLASLLVLAALLTGGWWVLWGSRQDEAPTRAAAPTPATPAAAWAPAAPPPAEPRGPPSPEGAAPEASAPVTAAPGPGGADRGEAPRSASTRALDEATPQTLSARPLPGVEARARPTITVRTPAPLPLPPNVTGTADDAPPATAAATVPPAIASSGPRAAAPLPAQTSAIPGPTQQALSGAGAAGAQPPVPALQRGLDSEARGFIADLTAPAPRPLSVERVDHFITRDQVLSLLPESAVESLTADDLARDPSLDDETPITVVHEIDQIETTTPERLIAEAAGDLDAPVRVVAGDAVRSTTVRDLLARHSAEPDAPIHVVRRVRSYEVTTPAELAREPAFAGGQSMKIIRQRYRLKAATIADLIRAEQAVEPDSVFYVRTVRPSDVQGLWGIVHDGIIGNFARGVAVRRGEEVDTFQVEIPRDADERLRDESSSFLGRMIHDKTRASWVYNFTSERMGRNPDSIVPGQEVVIVKFQPEELIAIYRHFADAES